MIQQFQESGLQGAMIASSEGNDDDVEKQMQQYLTIFKDRSGSQSKDMDRMVTAA